jgi:hypothetical protein
VLGRVGPDEHLRIRYHGQMLVDLPVLALQAAWQRVPLQTPGLALPARRGEEVS